MKQRNLFMSLTLICGFLSISFQFMPNGVEWFWKNSPAVAAILAVLAIVFGIFWIRSQRFLREK